MFIPSIKNLKSLSPLALLASLGLIAAVLIPVDSSSASTTPAFEMRNLSIRLVNFEDSYSASYKGFSGNLTGTEGGVDIDWTADWYACDSKTTFRATATDEAPSSADVADEAAVNSELSSASCTLLPTSGTYNRTSTTQSAPTTKYSFESFDDAGKQYVSLKLKGEASGKTTVFGVSTGFDRPEVATVPAASVSGSNISWTAATFTGDYLRQQTDELWACDSQLPGATDQSKFTKESATTSNLCINVTDENQNIPSTVEEAGAIVGLAQSYEPLDLSGKYISLISSLDSTVFEVSEGFLVTSSVSPTPYTGPIITDVGEDGIASPFLTFSGQTVRVDGERLSTVSKVFVDGKEGEVISTADDHFVMTVPDGISEGRYDLVINSSLGNLTYLGAFTVSDSGAENAVANAVCEGVETSWWTQRISDSQAKAYIKCPEVGQKYRILQQTGGSGDYDSVFVKTLTDENDQTQVFNEFGRYIVRTINLEDINRLRITVDDEELWKVRYNR